MSAFPYACPPELFVALLVGKTPSSSDSSSSLPDSLGVTSAARAAPDGSSSVPSLSPSSPARPPSFSPSVSSPPNSSTASLSLSLSPSPSPSPSSSSSSLSSPSAFFCFDADVLEAVSTVSDSFSSLLSSNTDASFGTLPADWVAESDACVF